MSAARRGAALVALAALLVAAPAVHAQTAQVTRARLANGLTVLVRENPVAPVVACSLQITVFVWVMLGRASRTLGKRVLSAIFI